jgi:aminomethyltransferase
MVTPTVRKAVGMAYVHAPYNKVNTELIAIVRDKPQKVTIRKMPFVPANYYNKSQ